MTCPTRISSVPSSAHSMERAELPVRVTVLAMTCVQPLLPSEFPLNVTLDAGA